ncbi:MAG TPA: elongation factor G [Gemmatimonadaceae bacterium]|nr:elongation factor G [Gemmatimonadaceae bacterium]
MREYKSQEIRNVAVVGHGASGKTSLVDALAFVSGSSKRHGFIKDGTTLTDTSQEEIERGYSISLGCAYAEWRDVKINLLDTPGFLDFQGDSVAGVAAADGALLAISATSGVEVGSERMFREAIARKDPVLFVVSMMDKEHADFDKAYDSIRSELTTKVVPVEIPIGAGPGGFKGIINLFTRKAHIFAPGTKAGEFTEAEIPDSEKARFERYHQELVETIAATDDALLERYLGGEQLTDDEEVSAMKEAMKRGDIFPLLCCSSQLTYGVRTVLDFLVQLMPSAHEMEELHAFTGSEGSQKIEIHPDSDAPFTALVFKTVSEQHVGNVSFFRTFRGTVLNGQEVYNATRDVVEKLVHLSIPQGKERIEVGRIYPGDIGCVAKLHNTHTNDTLSTKAHPVRMPQIHFPDPVVSYAVRAASRNDEEKLSQGMHRVHDEDPTFQTHYNTETHETIVEGLGERHIEVALARLARQFGVKAELSVPRIPYRETLTAKAEGQGRHKKQSGGRGQFGDCWVRLKPAARGSGYKFEDEIVGGVIPRNYIPAVDKGIQEASARGILARYPVVDFIAECYDGSYHSVDSNEASFKMAGILAFKTVAAKARPALLEPIDYVEVTTPDKYLGDVMGDLNSRRGQILGTDAAADGHGTRVRATMPQAELHLYGTKLSSITQGRATFTRKFQSYEFVPPEFAKKVIDAAAKEKQEEQDE